jgi:enamine deaminase RidA (YjgF/YER057c/UK114 family)
MSPSGASGCNTRAVQERDNITSGSPFELSIGFSRAVRVGDRVLVSGTGPIWPDGSCSGDPGDQASRCLEIIRTALVEAGTDLSAVIRTRMYLTDPAAADAVSAEHGRHFADIRPAATMVIVAGLLDPRWKVEIEGRSPDRWSVASPLSRSRIRLCDDATSGAGSRPTGVAVQPWVSTNAARPSMRRSRPKW